MVCGARLTTSYPRVGGLPKDLPPEFNDTIKNFLKIFPKALKEIDNLLTRNKIWRDRTKGVAVVTAEQAIDLGLTGPILRASGVPLISENLILILVTKTMILMCLLPLKVMHIQGIFAGLKRCGKA